MVWHDGLVSKLQSYGIGVLLLNRLKDYLFCRSQAVCVDGVQSKPQAINAGVLQGSVLGPTLFLIFINDLLETTSNPIHSFADDSTFHARLPAGSLPLARQEVADALESDLAKIDDWGKKWLMTFNAFKMTQLIISWCKDQNHPFSRYTSFAFFWYEASWNLLQQQAF